MTGFLGWAAEAASTTGADILTPILSAGPAGVVVVLFLTGKIVPSSMVDRLVKELQAKDAIIESKDVLIQKQHEVTTDKIIPALVRFTAAAEATTRGGPRRPPSGGS